MCRDRTVIWVLEYVFGAVLVIAPLAGWALWPGVWIDARIWAVGLCVVCLGVILVSCASSMRQRMLLARRIDGLAERLGQRVGDGVRS